MSQNTRWVAAIKAEALREAASLMACGIPEYDPLREGIAAFEPSHVAWLRDRAAALENGKEDDK